MKKTSAAVKVKTAAVQQLQRAPAAAVKAKAKMATVQPLQRGPAAVKAKTTAVQRPQPAPKSRRQAAVVTAPRAQLQEFFDIYGTLLELVAARVQALANRGVAYVSSADVAAWIAHDLPERFKEAFGKVPTELKTWRVQTMMSNASYLGAYQHLGIRAVAGRGLTPIERKLRVVK